MILDFEKARRGVLDVLRGKVNTPTAIKVALALKDAAIEPGKWEPTPIAPGFSVCSSCHDCYVDNEWLDGRRWKFCPACGAPMENGGQQHGDN